MKNVQRILCGDMCYAGPIARKSDEEKKRILDQVMQFEFNPLIHRLIDKHRWKDSNARLAFNDLKCFLFLCATSEKRISPSRRIDFVWHEFILFMERYESFCKIHFEHMIYHRPRLRDETGDENMLSPNETRQLAEKTFGKVSSNWKNKPKRKRHTHSESKKNGCASCMSG